MKWLKGYFSILSFVLVAAFFFAGAAPNPKAEKILIEKSKRTMTLFRKDGTPLKTYSVALGKNPVGPKTRQGDKKTPEGKYRISGRNPKSLYHLSLRISYPNPQDSIRAASLGVSPGGDIMIHGLPPSWAWVGEKHRLTDWTDGCVAVTDEEIEEIWKLVPDGTPVEILP